MNTTTSQLLVSRVEKMLSHKGFGKYSEKEPGWCIMVPEGIFNHLARQIDMRAPWVIQIFGYNVVPSGDCLSDEIHLAHRPSYGDKRRTAWQD